VAPPSRPGPVRMAKERHQRVERVTDLAGVEQALDGGPLGRHPELVADGEYPVRALGGGHETITLGDRDGHRLLEQHVLPRLHLRVMRDRRVAATLSQLILGGRWPE